MRARPMMGRAENREQLQCRSAPPVFRVSAGVRLRPIMDVPRSANTELLLSLRYA
jgi:hypothetical protein